MSAEQTATTVVRAVAIALFLFTVLLSFLSLGITLLIVSEDFSFYDSYFVVSNGVVEAVASLTTSTLLFLASKPLGRFICRGL